jgi:hypothetical protein
MDDIVLRGMAKWPDVPAVYGWLVLDRRGQWLLKGERIANPGVTAFIGRNYAHDEGGRWFFQNGPQRVFVALEYTPFVYRVVTSPDAAPELETHAGKPVTQVRGAWVDENGAVLLETEHGIGIVHDGDLDRLIASFSDAGGAAPDDAALEEGMEALQRGQPAPLWMRYRNATARVEPVRSQAVPRRFGFVPCPVQPAGEEACP